MIKSFETSKGIVLIREAQLSDVNKFRELRLFALKESPTAFSADYQANASQPMSFWKNRLKPDEYSLLVFGEHEDQLIGMTGIRRGDTIKTRHGSGIWGVYTHPDWRGLHVAEEMIELCCTWAKIRGVEIVKLGVINTNGLAIHLYERCGFTVYGIEPKTLFYEGKYYDSVVMFRNLK